MLCRRDTLYDIYVCSRSIYYDIGRATWILGTEVASTTKVNRLHNDIDEKQISVVQYYHYMTVEPPET